MKNCHLFFFILICILLPFRAAGSEEKITSPSTDSEKKDAEGKDVAMRTTRLESGVIVVENREHPHENLDLITRNHFLSFHFEPDGNLIISTGRNTGHGDFSFSIYENHDKSFCKYWFTLGHFSVLDYDGDGLADVRQKGSLPEYEIRLNDEWISCREIRLKDHRAVVSDGAVCRFEKGKWRVEHSAGAE